MEKFIGALDGNNGGYLSVCVGPMYSGKTTRLIKIINRLRLLNVGFVYVNTLKDVRDSKNFFISTHDGFIKENMDLFAKDVKYTDKEYFVKVNKLSELLENETYMNEIHDKQVILIDEGQFFDDLVESTLKLVDIHKKTLFVSGLDGNWKRDKFGNISDLLPHADHFKKISAFCHNCFTVHGQRNLAPFSYYISNDKNITTDIGGSDKYISLCRKCYNNM